MQKTIPASRTNQTQLKSKQTTFVHTTSSQLRSSKSLMTTKNTAKNKESLLHQIIDLQEFINTNFTVEADFLFVVGNDPESIIAAKQEFNNISFSYSKGKYSQFRMSFGMLFFDRKADNLLVSQPFKEFCKNSYEQFKNFIQVKYMGLDHNDPDLGNPFHKNSETLSSDEFLKILEAVDKVKWISKKAKICFFFFESAADKKTEAFLRSLTETRGLKFYFVIPKEDPPFEEEKRGVCSDTAEIIKPSKKNKNLVVNLVSSEIQKTCINIDFEILKEQTKKKNLLLSLNSETNALTSLQVNHFLSNIPLVIEIDPNAPEWNAEENEIFEARAISFFIVRDRNMEIDWAKPLIQSSSIKTKVWISKKPFAQGAIRYAFYIKDVFLKEKMVGKIPKILDEGYNIPNMQKDVESMIILEHLIYEFNDRIIWKFQSTDQTIFSSVHAYIYEILSSDYPYKYLWVENLMEGDYKKYNNNSGWKDQSESIDNQMAQAFSHFSWQFTKGYLIIVDLQGSFGIFTDPQIHCLDLHKFGSGNFGKLGILRFFLTHECKKFCKSLGLVHLNNGEEPKEDFWSPEFSQFEQILKNNFEELVRLCDLCKKPYKIKKDEWLSNKKKSFRENEDYCLLCLMKMDESKTDGGECEECGRKFNYSSYWFIMKRTEKPVRCSKCRRAKRDREREKLKQK